ncbi:MAG: Jag N-terminal domain-containing protein [Candidatus Omnitrophica bacterium]|nr:Jag N-terminal domain-containing protein [Candidatus Omnitrophota bacterium]
MSAKNKDSEMIREYEANTVEEAIKLALADLGLPKKNIKIQILTEGHRGLFGMEGAKKAKIRVSILSKKKPNNIK